MKKIILMLLLILATPFMVHAEEIEEKTIESLLPKIEWQRIIGGSSWEKSKKILKTKEGYFLILTETNSRNKDLSENKGKTDILVTLLNSKGRVKWKTLIGTAGNDVPYAAVEDNNGDFVIVGKTNGKDITRETNKFDGYFAKIDKSGTLLNDTHFGGEEEDAFYAVTLGENNSYIMVGETASKTINSDGWLLQVDENGIIINEKTYKNDTIDFINDIDKMEDGSYVMAGSTVIKGKGYQGWIIKTDNMFNMIKEFTIGGEGYEYLYDVEVTFGQSIAAVGITNSKTGKLIKNMGKTDILVLKLDSELRPIWVKNIGGEDDDITLSIEQSNKGGFLVAGAIKTKKEDILNYDYLIINLSSKGTILWEKVIGGSGEDVPVDIVQDIDGGIIVLGQSDSEDSEMSVNYGNTDTWVIKLEQESSELYDLILKKEKQSKETKVVEFSDVTEDNWFYSYVVDLTERGIISGYADGTFRPNQGISVEAFLKMVIGTMGYDNLESTDGYWASPYITKAKELMLITDDEIENYTRLITRKEIAKIVVRSLDEKFDEDLEKYNYVFLDVDAMDEFDKELILRAYAKGIISGYEDNTFRPENNALRSEATVIITRLIDPLKRNKVK